MKIQKSSKAEIKNRLNNKQNYSQDSNINLVNHPSCQTSQKTFKPSIKVSYKVISNKETDSNNQVKTGRRQVKNMSSINQKQNLPKPSSRVKIIDAINNQYQSGKFVDSQYCNNSNQNDLNNSRHNWYSRGKVNDARNKYQLSNSTQNCIKGQFIQKRGASCFDNSRKTKTKTQISDNMSLSRSKYRSQRQSEFPQSRKSENNLSNNSYINQKRKLPSYKSQGIKDIMQYWHAGQYRESRITKKCNDVQNNLKSRYAKFSQIHEFDFRKKIRQLQKIR